MKFTDLPIQERLQSALRGLGFEAPTPIQAQAIPHLLEGRDLVGQSKTGSGKTLAFALPILERIDLSRRTPQALLLLPTRELAIQVASEIRKAGRDLPGLQVDVLCGGQPFGDQRRRLLRGPHIIVGTPGRILDHLTRETLALLDVSFLVLDEADRMLEMGFQEDLALILDRVPSTRQSILFSATFPREIESLCAHFLKDPVRVSVEEPKSADGQSLAGENRIEEHFLKTSETTHRGDLAEILKGINPKAALVFCNFKASVRDVYSGLKAQGLSVEMLSGDLEQNARDRVMAKFRNQSTRILVATDVAARGIDVADVDLVVNFEIPRDPEIYTHRIGRTGRAGKSGLAISLLTRSNPPLTQASTVHDTTSSLLADLVDHELIAAPDSANRTFYPVMQTLYISGGRKDKLRPGDILGALTGEAGKLSGADIGKIEIHDFFSYVAIKTSLAPLALDRLRAGRIKARRFNVEFVR